MNKDLEIRQNLAAAHQILAKYHMDDLTYTHLSCRAPGGNSFFIGPFGLLFKEVTASNLLEVSFDGKIISGNEYQYNQTGYVIHGSLYRRKLSVNAIIHLHTIAGVSVSAMRCGLLPISQFSFHFYENIGYHDYKSLALDANHDEALSQDLGENKALMLKNHGTLTVGATLHEALFYSIYLEKACKVQVALSNVSDLNLPSPAICMKARNDMRNFEADLGKRDWLALIRELERDNSNYKD